MAATPASMGVHTDVMLEIGGAEGDPNRLPDIVCKVDESFEAVTLA